jgi:KipI family sensor histidine kinase inhibitor
LVESVPGFTTLLLRFSPGHRPDAEAFEVALNSISSTHDGASSSPTASRSRSVQIPVRYDGEDLARVAQISGLSEIDVVERHLNGRYRVHCLGFSPGFPYLGGLDPKLHTPRLATPRRCVPAGSVAIGGEHTGIYSVDSPGGWNLIGRTSSRLFNPSASSLQEMFLLRPGDGVQFIPWDGNAGVSKEVQAPPVRPFQPMLRVISTGSGLSIQDAGRPGFARFGIPNSGAMDPVLAADANRLLENRPDAPVLELGLQGQRFEVMSDGWLALGGDSALAPGRRGVAFRARAGETLNFPPVAHGVWRYLAIPGGWAGPELLGSHSGGARLGWGAVVQAGDVLGAQEAGAFAPRDAVARRSIAGTGELDDSSPLHIAVWPGPQAAEFDEEDRQRFFAEWWRVSSQCDRVGYRLHGGALSGKAKTLISEPVLPGSIQIPPDGQPIVTMPDGPTLGGYPKIGWIADSERIRLSQCRAGQVIRWVPIGSGW